MKYKKGVYIVPNWQYYFACFAVDYSFKKIVGHEAMMTSGVDGNHSDNSLHYQHMAWDFRVYVDNEPSKGRHSLDVLRALIDELKKNLGELFDVVLEFSKTTKQPHHIHIEFDPN